MVESNSKIFELCTNYRNERLKNEGQNEKQGFTLLLSSASLCMSVLLNCVHASNVKRKRIQDFYYYKES